MAEALGGLGRGRGHGRGRGRPRNYVEEESEESFEDPNANMWAHMMHQQQQFQAQQAQQHQEMMMMFQQQMQQNQNVGNAAFREFCRMSPPEFVGEFIPSKAREWIQRMGDILDSMQCSEAERVNFATRFFRGNACNWWESTKNFMMANQIEMNWTNFRCLFINHYVPESFSYKMEKELQELKQGSMSVAEYTMKFNELIRYAADGPEAPTEAWKIKKYRMGLRADIAHVVTMQPIANFGDLIQRSYHAEAGLEEIRKGRGEVMQKRKDHGKFNAHLKPKGSPSKGKHTYSPRSLCNCSECGFPHEGECPRAKGVCYYCRQPGHFKSECPKLKKQSKASGTTKSKGRVYSLDGKKNKSNNALIMDVCLCMYVCERMYVCMFV
ncbi:hypothetical protein TSUD_142090 [Trifolium subterraneum]|uniref:CCHC-type domain-containing protein n=1 Tax=Trifolium subterraneum TaxID=3900 RepID=A0A2Z6MD34_TRISU|nr:hypothetical protein TSUD_142090 [Trifolium subterraneum]